MKKPIQFGKYYLLDRVNVGGMAEVFKAKAFGVEGFERLLAVKRILPNIAEDEEFITMFIDEAKIAVQLNHANICQIFDLGKVEDSYFIALEYVHGKDVRAIFDRCKQKPTDGQASMPIAQACFIIMKACEGLDYAHNKKDTHGHEIHLVHRDVSPQNVLISYEGEVKLIDFGIAKAAGKMSKTQQGILKGKFGYMSPEQVRGLPLDRRSDVFSLGIVLYELLTGERLFIGESDFSTLEKVRNVEILPPSTYNRRISEELERIVMKALAKDVDDRYQNAIDLHDDLQAFMYTAGEFYSRKDLAAWMKKVWAPEIEAETAKLETYRSMPAPPNSGQSSVSGVPTPPSAPERPRRNSIPPPPPPPGSLSGSSAPPVVPAPPGARISQPHPVVAPPSPPSPPPASAKPANGHGGPKVGPESELGWDDEELATNIYDLPQDAEDAVVEDKPDLSAIELSDDGSPVPHNMSAAAMPPMKAQNGTARTQRPLDFVVPGSEPQTGSAIDHPVGQRPGGRPRAQSKAGLFTAVGVVGALVCAAAVALFVFLGGKPGEVVITSDPSVNVQILVDNKRVAVDGTPAKLKLEPGSYVLTVQREGFVPWNEQVEIKAGETLRKQITLEPLASGTGFTLVSDPPALEASLDGRTLGVTPLKVQSVTPGKHRIDIKGQNGAAWTQEVDLEAGKILEVRANVTPAVAAAQPVAPVAPKPGDKGAPAKPDNSAKPTNEKVAAKPAPVKPEEKTPAPVAKSAPEKPAVVPAVATAPDKSAAPSSKAQKEKTASAPRELPRLPKEDVKEKPADKPKTVSARPALVDEDTDAKPVAKAKPAAAEKPSASAGEGYLRLGSKPWTNIAVDGKDSGLHTPQTQLKLSSGSHRVTLTNPQFNIKETFSVDIKTGETTTVIKDLRPQGADTD